MADLDKLGLLKANLGISGNARDPYLQSILDAVTDELQGEKGIDLMSQTAEMFLVDYSAWRFRNRGEGVMPRNLQYRLHNLMVGGDRDA